MGVMSVITGKSVRSSDCRCLRLWRLWRRTPRDNGGFRTILRVSAFVCLRRFARQERSDRSRRDRSIFHIERLTSSHRTIAPDFGLDSWKVRIEITFVRLAGDKFLAGQDDRVSFCRQPRVGTRSSRKTRKHGVIKAASTK